MRSFLRDLFRNPRRIYRVILIDDEDMAPPRHHHLRPVVLLSYWGASLGMIAILVIIALAFTPLRLLIPGYYSEETVQQARINSLRLEALEDSLMLQQQYQVHLQRLITGDVDSSLLADAPDRAESFSMSMDDSPGVLNDAQSENWRDHEQPALSLHRMPRYSPRPASLEHQATREPSRVRFPVLPPVDGYVTRGFDAESGHYAIDIAVQEGTAVRSIGSGYIIMADWTQEGGYSIAVQHADGFVSVYKHNSRLLKRLGDRVGEREAIALSGDSGDFSTGPHVHIEVWRNGLAQDPDQYFVTP